MFRDLSERRKAPLILVRRGLALYRDEPRVIARMEQLGAQSATPRETTSALAGVSSAGSGPSAGDGPR